MADIVKLKDKSFSLNIPSGKIQEAVCQVAERINHDLIGECPIFLVILNGSFMFASDLLKHIRLDCHVSFVKLASYEGMKSTEVVRHLIGVNEEIRGRHVIILEDIIDTGITMENMLHEMKQFEPADIRIATLLYKPAAFVKDFTIDYVGIEIPNDFIVGYGLDYDGIGRNLPDIYKIIPE